MRRGMIGIHRDHAAAGQGQLHHSLQLNWNGVVLQGFDVNARDSAETLLGDVHRPAETRRGLGTESSESAIRFLPRRGVEHD